MKLIKLAKFFAMSRKLQVGQKLRLRQDFLKRIGLIAKKLDKVKLRLFVPRKVEPRPIYSNSTWGQMLINPRVKDPADKKGGVLFRRRFRIPYPMFEQIVQLVRKKKWFSEKPDVTGRVGAPLELKILGVLRVLGRGYCFDGIEELSFISAEVNRIFFHKFCTIFSLHLWDKFCSPPKTDAEIERTMGIYKRVGLPGAIGSTDCVHIRWERCPAGDRFHHKGKEGFTTLSYELTCDHTSKIIAVTKGHPGARNDKTIVLFNGFVSSIHSGELYKDVKLKLKDLKGVEYEEKGAYLIVDGGYHKWRCLQCPLKHSAIPRESLWSEWVETVRKDVECVFGVLKGRFRCLKLPIYYHDKKSIDDMFFTCCILHNMLLKNDGLDKRWENGVNYAGVDGNHSDEDMQIFRQHLSRVRNLVPTTDFTSQGTGAIQDRYDICHGDNFEEYESSYTVLQKKLINNFSWQYAHNEIQWLKKKRNSN